ARDHGAPPSGRPSPGRPGGQPLPPPGKRGTSPHRLYRRAEPRTERLADVDAAARVVAGMFDDLGFDPELAGDPRDRQIRLRACPFRAAARANPEVVCSVHRGLMRGTLDRLGTPQTTVRLLPFVEPDLCLAHLTTVD